MMIRTAIAAAILFAAFALPSFAQQTPPPSPAQSNDWSVETVTITKRSTGPAIWHATKGDADVAILGIVEPLPENFVWNSKPLAELMNGATVVLLPPRAQANIFQAGWFLLTERDLLSAPDGKTVWDMLSPPLATRFAAARDMLHEDKDRYDDNAPVVAALRLERDYMKVNAMTLDEPEDTIHALARENSVPIRRIATYDVLPGAEELLKQPPAKSAQCVDAAVSDVDIASNHAAAAAEAWALGDVAGVKENWSQPKIYECLLALSPLVTALDRKATDDTVNEIMAALAKGGHAVAVVSIGLLLRKNGVLERLIASGVPVTAPRP
jgi:hypothetical protein